MREKTDAIKKAISLYSDFKVGYLTGINRVWLIEVLTELLSLREQVKALEDWMRANNQLDGFLEQQRKA